MKSSTGNGARCLEIACISDLKMVMLVSETSIYARTAEINVYYLMKLSVLRYSVLIRVRSQLALKCLNVLFLALIVNSNRSLSELLRTLWDWF